ncbi:MAG: hypothetical protein FWF59_11905 [Turicibacter sp.]|nr:hypothetical protein [Turicibacter sp.]
MRKNKVGLMLLLALGLAASLVYAFRFSNPAVRAYQFGQNIDDGLADAALSFPKRREELLDLLQRDVGDLVRIGQNYEAGLNIDREFAHFHETYGLLGDYIATVTPKVEAIYHRSDFNRALAHAGRAGIHASVATGFISYQQERMGALLAVHGALAGLYEALSSFEAMFFEPDPWVAVPYFQEVLDRFDEIAVLHDGYLDALGSYARTKTDFYLAIRQGR